MKKFFCLFLALGMVISLMGCAKSTDLEGQSMTTGSDFVLTEPPTLEFFCGEETLTAALGGYSWSNDNFDGTWNDIIADGLHPLDAEYRMETLLAQGEKLTLVFGVAPESYTVRCWPETAIGTGEHTGEQTVSTDGWEIELLDGGYVYEVTAHWSYESFHGSAFYCFRAVRDTHTHQPASQPQTVEEPISGYCGNTQTTVKWEGKEYTLTGSDAITLMDLVINLAYAPENLCRCAPELSIITEDGGEYGVNLTEAFVRCDAGQAGLTAGQIGAVEDILDELK